MAEPKYTVTSDRLVGHDQGDTVTAKDLEPGTNVAALVAAGHLKPARTSKANNKE